MTSFKRVVTCTCVRDLHSPLNAKAVHLQEAKQLLGFVALQVAFSFGEHCEGEELGVDGATWCER